MIPLLAECAVKDGNYIYFASLESSIIFSLSLLTGKIEIVGCVPEELFFKDRLVGEFLRWKDQFVLIPCNAKNIWIVDKKFEHWEKIELKYVDPRLKFLRAIIIDNKIYALRHFYPYSICVDLETREVAKMHVTDGDFFTSAVNIESEIYYPSCDSNKIFKYNVETGRMVEFKAGTETYNAILHFDNNFYLAPRGGRQLLVWNEREERTIPINYCNALGIFEFEKKIYVAAYGENNESFYIDSDGCVKEWNLAKKFRLAKSLDDETYCLMDYDGKIYIFDRTACEIKIFLSEIDEDEMKAQASKSKYVMKGEVCQEVPRLNLKWLLTEMIIGLKEERGKGRNDIGSTIWALMSK